LVSGLVIWVEAVPDGAAVAAAAAAAAVVERAFRSVNHSKLLKPRFSDAMAVHITRQD